MSDRLVFILLYRLAPSILNAVTIVRPETIVRWHRAGFRSFWRWKSRRHAGRPSVAPEIRRLIREMSLANPLWSAPRIHGKLGIDVGQTSVAKSMTTSVARLENVPPQPCRRDRLDRPVCGSDDLISVAIWVARAGTRPSTHSVASRHSYLYQKPYPMEVGCANRVS